MIALIVMIMLGVCIYGVWLNSLSYCDFYCDMFINNIAPLILVALVCTLLICNAIRSSSNK